MKTEKYLSVLIIISFFLFSCTTNPVSDRLKLWYDTPATNWNEALPVGNGFMGAMVFGDTGRERIQLNENTLYSGEPSSRIESVDIAPRYDEVVKLLKSGEYQSAQQIMVENWQGRLPQSYLSLGDLYIDFNHQNASSYTHTLDLEKSIVTTSYEYENIRYTREIFASNPDRILVYRVKTDKKNAPVNFSLYYTSPHPTTHISFISNNEYSITGQAPGYCDRRPKSQLIENKLTGLHPEYFNEDGTVKYDKPLLYGDEINDEGMFFESRIKVVKGEATVIDNKLHVSGDGEVVFYITAATSYNGLMKSPSREGADYKAKNAQYLNNASAYGYDELFKRHLNDYKKLFDRVSININSDEDYTGIPTDKRIIDFHKSGDNDLVNLLFQFGRYLLISSSREGGQPANLQGLWNEETVPRWNCGYTMNINLEMNYWLAELTGLQECTPPLFEFIEELSVTGKTVAEKMYHLPGWTAHHNTSLWRETYPTDGDPSWTFWNLTPAWLCRHIWEHYLFTRDKELLKEKYPLMRSAAEFYSAWLIQDEEGHWLTPIGVSPENIFYTDEGEKVAVSMAPTMDMAILRDFFTILVETSDELGENDSFIEQLKEKRDNLLPYQVGSKGQLQEWMYDFKETEPDHRHLSHLYGLYPGDELTYTKTPALMEAARQSLLLRGDEATGWSMGWKINLWARMKDGDHAYNIIRNLFTPVDFGDKEHQGGGLYKNLLDAHPPFQIDGNFGFTAGVTEMLLQSHDNVIEILPALPDVWHSGEVKGLRARGGFIVDIQWKDGIAEKVVVESLLGSECNIMINGEIQTLQLPKGSVRTFSVKEM